MEAVRSRLSWSMVYIVILLSCSLIVLETAPVSNPCSGQPMELCSGLEVPCLVSARVHQLVYRAIDTGLGENMPGS